MTQKSYISQIALQIFNRRLTKSTFFAIKKAELMYENVRALNKIISPARNALVTVREE